MAEPSKPALVRHIEQLAFDAWPAAEVERLGGWRLRFNRGVTNRANCVWPNELTGALALDERIARVEAAYRARGLPAKFQITPAAQPRGLDAELARRGYAEGAHVLVETAPAAAVAGPSDPARGVETEVAETPDEAWFELSGRRGRFRGESTGVYRGLLARLCAAGPARRAAFALARLEGEPVAVGLGVLEGAWAGIFSMRTLESARRRGAGVAVLRALARFAAARGVRTLYLQVERDAAPARALYARAGFGARYGYHYRVEVPPPA
jgi:ribosomal protein S18 acetylase RimI-like enzyme